MTYEDYKYVCRSSFLPHVDISVLKSPALFAIFTRRHQRLWTICLRAGSRRSMDQERLQEGLHRAHVVHVVPDCQQGHQAGLLQLVQGRRVEHCQAARRRVGRAWDPSERTLSGIHCNGSDQSYGTSPALPCPLACINEWNRRLTAFVFFNQDPKLLKWQEKELVPLGRFSTPDEQTYITLLLLDPVMGGYMTGTEYFVDGGAQAW